MHAFDDNGLQLNAQYAVEQDNGQLALVLESSGGRTTTGQPRNADYRQALTLLLTRLRARDASITDAFVDSKVTQHLPEHERALINAPIRLTDLADMEALRVRLTGAQGRVGQPADAPKAGNNSKRLRLRLEVPGYGVDGAARLAADLATPSLSLSRTMQRVLDLAAEYAKEETPAMRERDQATAAIALALRAVVEPAAERLGLQSLALTTEPGGRRSSYSPVPWVRVHSRVFSESAQAGYYLAYLFAADGKRVYLSLMQGTSEWRANAMRPVNDGRRLRDQAATARRALEDLGGSVPQPDAWTAMDLAWRPLTVVGRESRKRIENYEDATILACEYRSGSIPPDERLLSDLGEFLPLLAHLYGGEVDLTPTPPPQSRVDSPAERLVRQAVAKAQGLQPDPVAKRAVEVRAEDVSASHLEGLGWTVARVGAQKLGYDLDCYHPLEGRLHVEVKGTLGLGEKVHLTRGEVLHTRDDDCEADHALFIVSEIGLDKAGDVRGVGGKLRSRWPWEIDDNHLTPTVYRYEVPQGS